MRQMDQTWVSGLSLRHAALIAGVTYLLNPVTFAQMYAMPRLVDPDAARTVANITAHPQLFAAAILSYFFSLLGDVIFAWAFYVLLAPVNRALSLLAAWLQLVYAAVALAAIGNLGVLYRIILIPDYASRLSADTKVTQAILLLGSFRSAWGFSLVLFGFHLVVLGWLMTRSTYLPKWLGWLLFVDGWAWVLDSLSLYLFPNAHLGWLQVIFGVELVFMVWLLGWGWRLREPVSTV